ncbi:afadin isoform X2 [Microplitis demolitor]|uniref:afadin isoform X2 n=1 Tax=Microplitis demolitor TaxID=69319 RepID=UPI00235B6B7F|nr:afadin isoform X2 [Microplitis demolitor]
MADKNAEREALRGVIQQWNANRLDLFELSEPNEDLEFHGVMRFYFQDSGQKVATKCIRVASDATSQAVIETLIEKFRPDMRMLSVPEYALYEIHENGERKLSLEEKPLLVQLNWHIDDREGRFLLRRIDDKTNTAGVGFGEATSFRRKLSKRERKQLKRQEKICRLKTPEQCPDSTLIDKNGVAEKLYVELPETSFTRSISNPEAVMRRRRQQKLEKKLQQFRSKDGGPDTGGTLKIYGEALCKDVPYKTLLLSIRDSAAQVVREMLSKYGLDKVDSQQYCLVQVTSEKINGNTCQEYILDDDECPLAIIMNYSSAHGSIMFHVRRRPADYVPRKRKKKPTGKWGEMDHKYEDERLPFLLELNADGTDVPNGAGVRHRLLPNVTEVGSETSVGSQAVHNQTLTLCGPTVMPRHCVIAFTENIVTLTPASRDAYTYVNNQRIHQTTILQNGAVIKFGRLHTFRFIDPAPEDRIRQCHDSNKQMEYSRDRSETNSPNDGQCSTSPSPIKSHIANICSKNTAHSSLFLEGTHNYETTFDLDGNVETASLTSSRDSNRLSQQYDRQPRGTDPILPAVLEFLEETEDTFLHAVITDVEPSSLQFKLAPTYTLYLAARYRASTHYRSELQPTERAHRLTIMLANVATRIQRVIQERYMDAPSLALWLSNGSEFLHFLKNDRHIGAFSTRAQDILVDAVQTAFGSLINCVSLELNPAMSQFMADADEPAKEAGVLQIFSNTMALLRRYRVNAALTIQLFSHLFHAINATAFNILISNNNLCVRWFGRRLKARLNAIETWAERQGLELASQCHLATIMQATHLLQAPKYNTEELATLSSTCLKLNSLQVRALLQKYQPTADEPRLTAELIENVVKVIENVTDTLIRADGREIRLEEEPSLALALLLPEDGYSCEIIRGVPQGLDEFLTPLQRDGLCKIAPQLTSSGYWTIYMIDHHNNFRSPSSMSNRSSGYAGHVFLSHGQPEIQIIKLQKSSNGMGLSIVAAKGAGQDRLGIYIKSVVSGGAAEIDGRLTAGDQLLKVDGQSLVGITQEKAAEYLVRTGPIVTLEVAKQGAIYHGLATLLSQPSPVTSRAHKARPKSEYTEVSQVPDISQPSTSHSMGNLISASKESSFLQHPVDWYPDSENVLPGPRRMSERDIPLRFRHEPDSQQIHSSKSVPALHSVETDNKQLQPQLCQHEVFNPGYSRTSSSNSTTPPVQPPPMPTMNGVPSLRSRSSNNLLDPTKISHLPLSGLINRQRSSPNLNPSQSFGNALNNIQNNEAERFYQNLSIYRHQDPTSKQMGPYQTSIDRNPIYTQKNPKGSQNSLNRTVLDANQGKDRPVSAYISQDQQINYNANQIQQQGLKLQSSKDIIRQEAKLQEMKEEVRRRELRAGTISINQYRPNSYNVRPTTAQANVTMYKQTGLIPSLDSNPSSYNLRQVASNHGSSDPQNNPYGLHNKQIISNQYAVISKKNDASCANQKMTEIDREYESDLNRSRMEYNQQLASYNKSQFLNDPSDISHQRNMNENTVNRIHNENDINKETLPFRSVLENEYKESHPPPPLNTSTHPLYTKQIDSRYTASMQDTPTSSYYSTISSSQQSRQHQYNATNPWQREEREKEQARRREAAKLWRDQQIAELNSLSHRTQQQEEQLRALQLERDFQKRAEEAAAQQDDDEEGNDLENHNTLCVQGLLKMTATPEKNYQLIEQNVLTRANVANQSIRGTLSSQSTSNQLKSSTISFPTATSQQDQTKFGNINLHDNSNINSQHILNINDYGQVSDSSAYNSPLVFEQLANNLKITAQLQADEEEEKNQRMDKHKCGSTDFDDSYRKNEEETKQSQQTYQQNQSNLKNHQHQLYSEMLKLDNLHINGGSDAPVPPERGSSYTVMSQQAGLRSSNSTTISTPIGSHQISIKRVSFHDSNANIENFPKNSLSITSHISPSFTMGTIKEDPNNFINDAKTLLASPQTPDGPGSQFGGNTPGVIGAQEIYKDPRQKRLAEKQKQQENAQSGEVPEKLSFKEKMKMFAMETGEDGTPRDKVKISRAQREIDNITSPSDPSDNDKN